MSKVKITVVKKISMKDLFGDNLPSDVNIDMITPQCDQLEEGQEFIMDRACPPDFCSWAFADIQRDIIHIAMGGSYPWIKDNNVAISCCTDGLRPVIFKIERIED